MIVRQVVGKMLKKFQDLIGLSKMEPTDTEIKEAVRRRQYEINARLRALELEYRTKDQKFIVERRKWSRGHE